MNNFHFFTQKVLPLVYDDSLSYYEVLAKVVYKLNECIDGLNNVTSEGVINFIESGQADDALRDRIDEIADDLDAQVTSNTNALEDTLLKYDHFYKVTDLEGVVNDGTTDCYYGLRQLMDGIYSRNEKAIVYFPSGTYKNETGILPVPANTIIIGDGPSTILFRTNIGAVTDDTGCLCPAGDNIAIYNLKIILNVENAPLQTGPLAVGIGITNIAYPGVYPEFNINRVLVRKNITVDSVYSDGIYPLQAEIAAGTGRLENITFKNGNYPNGIVSMYPWHGANGNTSPGHVGSKIENITCKWLRVGGRVSGAENFCMYSAGLMISNCKAEMAWLMADGILANNLLIDARNDLSLDNQYINYALMTCGKVTINNAFLIGGGASRTYGIINRSLNEVKLTGVTARDFASAYSAQTFNENQTPGNAMLTNCDFGEPNCGVVGYAVNSILNVPSAFKFVNLNKMRYVSLTAADGVTFETAARARVYSIGVFAWVQVSVTSVKSWAPANKIFTLPQNFRPVGDNVAGAIFGIDQANNAFAKPVNVKADGLVEPWATDASITAWHGIVTAMFTIM